MVKAQSCFRWFLFGCLVFIALLGGFSPWGEASVEDISHQTHLNTQLYPRGPGLGLQTCQPCHISADPSSTDIDSLSCNGCHSPDGEYNGVESLEGSVGARDNWIKNGASSSIYDSQGLLREDKGKWCVGCHDNGTSKIEGIIASNIAGMNLCGTWRSPSCAIGEYSNIASPGNLIDGNLKTGNTPWGGTCLVVKLGESPMAISHIRLYMGPKTSGYAFHFFSGETPENCTLKIGGGYFGRVLGGETEGWYQTRLDVFSPGRYLKILKTGGPSAENAIREVEVKSDLQFGYFHTGHKITCDHCHDTDSLHIDGEARTYNALLQNYQIGYRLNDVNLDGQTLPPMEIPRIGCNSGEFPRTDNDFALCFACHDKYKLLGNASSTGDYFQNQVLTNFRDDSHFDENGNIINAHLVHLRGRSYCGGSQDWDSDWDGLPDSPQSCPACHNVHGSPTPAMTRHGELVSAPGTLNSVPMINLHYFNINGVWDADLFDRLKSIGAKTEFLGPAPGCVEKNHTCNMCHNDQYAYYRLPVSSPITDCQSCHPEIKTHPSHATHLDPDPRGPAIACTICHADTSSASPHLLLFEDGKPLSETKSCDPCHSPDGAFDGINDPVIGAKTNWRDGVYKDDRSDLNPGIENWCAGCHDDGTSLCAGVAAPNVMGDNTTYGYNITGHKMACSACHDLGLGHIDGDYRSYSHESNPSNLVDLHNYQNGYRLKYRMVIPLGLGPGGGYDSSKFDLCFQCHVYEQIMGETLPFRTNFQDDGINRHAYHLKAGRYAWDSDWDYLISPDQPIIVDNQEAEFVGSWVETSEITGCYGLNYQQHLPGDGSSTVSWTPCIPMTGKYNVYVNWTSAFDRASNAQYSVVYEGGSFTKVSNQRMAGGQWNLLGYFQFKEGSSGYVQLSDKADGLVVADAVMFSYPVIDSRMSCPACHNVHGSPNPAMIRHGELISTPGTKDKVPALSFGWYKQDGYTPTFSGPDSLYADMPVLGGPGGGSLEESFVCVGCHGGPNPIKYDRLYQQLPMPTGSWARPALTPSLRLLKPQPESIDVAADSPLSFLILSDGVDELDWSTFSINIQIDSSTFSYTDEDTQVVTTESTTAHSVQVMVDPPGFWDDQENIRISLSISDKAGDVLHLRSWCFKTGSSSPVIWKTPKGINSENLFWSPEYLIDDHPERGNAYTPFSSHSVTFDLGQNYWIGQIRLLLPSPNGRLWTISVSKDTGNFGEPVKQNCLASPQIQDIRGIVCDNTEATFVGEWANSTTPKGFYGTNYQLQATVIGQATASCTWTPLIPQSGKYHLYARWASLSNGSTDASYIINYHGGSDLVLVDQYSRGGLWNLLGTYSFLEGASQTICLGNNSKATNTMIVADALLFIPVESLPSWAIISILPKEGRYLKLSTGGGPLENDTFLEIDFAEVFP